MDLGQLFQKLNDDMIDIQQQIQISMSALDSVIERTEKFREGFFSRKKISDQANGILTRYQNGTMEVTDMRPEEIIQLLSDTISDFKNLQVTVMAEIDRLDE